MAKAKVSKEAEKATELFNGLSVDDASKLVTEVNAAYHRMLDEKRDKELTAAKEKLAGSKDVATIKTLVAEVDEALEAFEDKTFKVTYNIPVTFEFSWNTYNSASDLVNNVARGYGNDVFGTFETNEFKITIGKGDLNAAQRKAIQQVVEDGFGDICGESLLLFPEQYEQAKKIMKSVEKAADLVEKVKNDGNPDFNVMVAIADDE